MRLFDILAIKRMVELESNLPLVFQHISTRELEVGHEKLTMEWKENNVSKEFQLASSFSGSNDLVISLLVMVLLPAAGEAGKVGMAKRNQTYTNRT